MNFYELFEKKEDNKHQQDVTISDPKAALALKQARAKYTYADSDLEAFVKMTQDKEEEEDKEISKVEREVQHAEKEIKDLETVEKQQQVEIDHLEKENDLQDKSIQKLTRARGEFEALAGRYQEVIASLGDQIADLESRVAKSIKGFETTPSQDYYHTARLAARDLTPPKSATED